MLGCASPEPLVWLDKACRGVTIGPKHSFADRVLPLAFHGCFVSKSGIATSWLLFVVMLRRIKW